MTAGDLIEVVPKSWEQPPLESKHAVLVVESETGIHYVEMGCIGVWICENSFSTGWPIVMFQGKVGRMRTSRFIRVP